MLSNKDILEKAEKILERKKYVSTCIAANICPDCGENLIDSGEDDYIELGCNNCGEEYKEKKYIFFGPIMTKKRTKYFY